MFRDFLIEREIIVEMSTICQAKHGFGFVAKMLSNDHNPPHFHVETLDGKKIAKIEITENVPKNFDDLKILKIHSQKDFDKIKKKSFKMVQFREKRGKNLAICQNALGRLPSERKHKV